MHVKYSYVDYHIEFLSLPLLPSQKWLCLVSISRPISASGKRGAAAGGRKRGRNGKKAVGGDADVPASPTAAKSSTHSVKTSPHEKNFTIVDKYVPIFTAEFIASGEMVVVETPWIQVMKHFPNVLHRKPYGT